MKAKLKLVEHSIIPDAFTIEVWYEGKMVMTLYGTDGPGVRIISKFILVSDDSDSDNHLSIIETKALLWAAKA